MPRLTFQGIAKLWLLFLRKIRRQAFPTYLTGIKFTVLLNTTIIVPSILASSRLFHFILVLISTSLVPVLILQSCIPKHLIAQCQERSQVFSTLSLHISISHPFPPASNCHSSFPWNLNFFLNVFAWFYFSFFLSLLSIYNRARGTSFPISPVPDIGITWQCSEMNKNTNHSNPTASATFNLFCIRKFVCLCGSDKPN